MTSYTNSQLKDIVYEIRNSKLSESRKKDEFSKKYPDFLEKYPSLFQCALDSNFPLTFFEFMIEQKTKYFDQDNATNLDEGDKVVYDELRNFYITPHTEQTQRQTQVMDDQE